MPCKVVEKDVEEGTIIIIDFDQLRERVLDKGSVPKVIEPAEDEWVRKYMEDRERKFKKIFEQAKEEL
ncbi:MAG: hypothetical protein ABEJ24_00925 [Candidatus Magasanikbacteria bacterium]